MIRFHIEIHLTKNRAFLTAWRHQGDVLVIKIYDLVKFATATFTKL